MDPGLSDLLTCPRCGPTYGLILLPEERQGRRVVRGVLGCANCRERYPVESGVADLRVAGHASVDPTGTGSMDSTGVSDSIWAVPGEESVRLGGLVDLAEVRGTILIAGPAAAHAAAVARLSQNVTVVGVGAGASDPGVDSPVSRVRATSVLPFRSGTLSAVVLTGRHVALASEAVRVLGRGGRLLVEPLPDDMSPSWDRELEPLARQGRAFLATRK